MVAVRQIGGDSVSILVMPAVMAAASARKSGTYLVVAHDSSPHVTIYKRNGDTFTKLDDPAALPGGVGYGAAFSPDGAYLAVAHYTSPHVTIYKRNGDTFTKLDDPAALP